MLVHFDEFSLLSKTSMIEDCYQPSSSDGKTTDPNGRVIAQGNVLASLVADLL
jgi:hypothetical protein